MEVHEVTTETARRETVPILRQLWTDLEPSDILEWTGSDDYQLFGGYIDGDIVGVAGVQITDILHHDRHAWLYDLVVDESHRGCGYGTLLVECVEEWAKDNDCEFVALASPLANEEVHRFYENSNFERWGYVIEKQL